MFGNNLFTFFRYTVQWGCVGHCVFEHLGDFVTCSGPSMEPTLRTRDLLLTERVSKKRAIFDRGDVVIAKCPNEPQTLICKRIVGLPGDKIEIKPRFTWNPFSSSKSIITVDENDNIITANDIEEKNLNFALSIDDNQINNQFSSQRTFRSRMIYVPKGHVWLEGDNSENSQDSRNYGPVPAGLIVSRAMVKLWPLNDVTLL